MTLYVDSSAFTKRYIDTEQEHAACREAMQADPRWATSRITLVETPRSLHRSFGPFVGADAIREFEEDQVDVAYVDVDRTTLAMAREVAFQTGVKTLDAIHLASALRVGDGDELRVLTYHNAQARAARALGLRCVGD